MNGLPYYRRYPRDFLEATGGWKADLKGAYSTILDLIYLQNGRLLDDPRYISGHIGCSVRQWNIHRDALINLGKIVVDLGVISNFRADNELIISGSYQDNQREKAKERWKNKDLPDAGAMPRARSTTSTTVSEKREAKASPKKTGSRLSDDWFLPADWGQWALVEGWQRETIKLEAEKFRDFWHSKAGSGATKLDWQATWRNWMRNAKGNMNGKSTFNSNGNGLTGGNGRGPSLASIVARRRLADQDAGEIPDGPERGKTTLL